MTTGHWIIPKTSQNIPHHELMARLAKSRVVLLGESHDRAAQHLWQMHVAAGILAHRDDIVMGFEMFPARLNDVLQHWVKGELSERKFIEKSQWSSVWGFDPELYMPLFRFCRAFQVPMIGLNCRRGLVSEVGKDGWDSISDEDREGLSDPRPASQNYRQYLFDITGGARPDRQAKSADDPAFDRFVRAQQVWDRAFACRIAEIAKNPNAPLLIGIIGRGHLEYRGGTPFQLDDLGISDSVVLLPDETGSKIPTDIADAVFRLHPTKI